MDTLKLKNCLTCLLGSAILAFGLYHIHSFSQVTEGGQLGLTLLLRHWFSVSPALSSFIINCICYFIGWRTLGKTFIGYSAVCTLGFSATFWICEQFPPLWPQLVDFPLAACLLGALFVGAGTGLCVRVGGAPSGDDGLVMSISKVLNIKIEYVYIFFDLLIIGLSLTYIPLKRIAYSIATATLSSWIIGIIQRLPKKDL
ncbi:MAG: YitT family protein [Oscillospiraceae bacterium]|nr:YitT family protein [Oscillospiraceae bacterium]